MESSSKGGPPGVPGREGSSPPSPPPGTSQRHEQDVHFQALHAISELRHPHLVAMRRASAGAGFEPAAPDGLSLAQLDEDSNGVGVLTLPTRLRVLLDALSGLAALHHAKLHGRPIGFVHGEVAPHNITVGRDGIGRLVPLVESHWSTPPLPSPESLGYVAPERLLADVFDQRADVFSIGVLLWEAIAERRLFRNLSMDAIVTQLVGGKVGPPPPPRGAPWAEALADVAIQALAVDPADRWPHVGVMGAEIETIAEGYLASSEEIALLVRRRAGGDRQPVSIGAPPPGMATQAWATPNAIATLSKPDATLVSTADPVISSSRAIAPPSSGGVVWRGPSSARTPSEFGRGQDSSRSSSPDGVRSSRRRPSREVVARQSKIVWTAVGLGTALFLLTAYEYFEAASSTATAGPTDLPLLTPTGPVATDPTGSAAVPRDIVTPPPLRPQPASDAIRSAAKATTPPPPPAAPRSPSSPRVIAKPLAPPAVPPAAAPAPPASAPETPTTTPPVPKPKEDPFGI